MKWMRTTAAAALMTVGVAACGDDGPTEPVFARAELGGSYALQAFSFDPTGSLPRVDILARLGAAQTPVLVVSPTSNLFQLQLRDPDTGFITTLSGTYRPTVEGLVLNFQSDADAGMLLLPRRAEFTFDAATRTLLFADADASVLRTRLVELVPEFENEQLPATVIGSLELRFVPMAVEEG